MSVKESVLVAGGGPAGLAAAIALRQRGFPVTVADAAHPPVDKACGEGIAPIGLHALSRLGVELEGYGFPFHGVRFVDGPFTVEAPFPSTAGLGIRRTVLHALLMRRAEALGVRFAWGKTVANLSATPSHWLIAADGLNSSVRKAAGLDVSPHISTRFGFRRHYRVPPWTGMVEVHWQRAAQLYVTPVSDSEVGVALLTRDTHLRLSAALRACPVLDEKLRGAEPVTAERGSPTITRRLRSVFRGNTILVGDASGSVDAITGEGLSLCFVQALALAEALHAGDLESYAQSHRQSARYPTLLARALLLLDAAPWLRPAVWTIGAHAPAVVAHVMAQYQPAGAGAASGITRVPGTCLPPCSRGSFRLP
ncbi:MAG TPA: FAD-dependent monooxygenase [Candidatus Limnocylindrales bacterium]|nr:FAD-dependent monooxygenase [Candidatus Limnocylindrales bacterium]